MPAVMRGAPRAKGGRSSARAPAPSRGGSSPSGPRQGAPKATAAAAKRRAPAPSKLTGAGIKPQTALSLALVVLTGGVALMLATGGRAHALAEHVEQAFAGRLASAGFQVKSVELEGASRFSIPYILRAAGVTQGEPMLGLDLEAIRQRVEKVGWVRSVRVLRLMPDTLMIAVAERPRLAVWQVGGKSYVIDPTGQIIPEADPGLFIDLPLIVGDGANVSAAALLPALTSRPRLMSKLDAVVRVDQRRWDLRLKDGSLIQLPAQNEDAALIQLDQLDQKDRLLDLGFQRVDLRDPEMIAVRPRDATAQEGAMPQTAPPPPAPGALPTAAAPAGVRASQTAASTPSPPSATPSAAPVAPGA
jgi:cell division protein FtsQ